MLLISSMRSCTTAIDGHDAQRLRDRDAYVVDKDAGPVLLSPHIARMVEFGRHARFRV
jgi:hypothetical protein